MRLRPSGCGRGCLTSEIWQAYSAVSLEDVDSSSRPRGTIANGVQAPKATTTSAIYHRSLSFRSPSTSHSDTRVLRVEGPRSGRGARGACQMRRRERARTRPTTDRRYTADFPKISQGLGLTLGLGDGKADTGPDLHGPAGIGGREDGSMGLFCLEDV